MDRRHFLASLSSLFALQVVRSLHLEAQAVTFTADPFSLGIASGEPMSDSVILWTRLAPDLMAANYGLKPEPIDVQWEIAEDQAMKKIVGHGHLAATPEMGHSVQVEAKGLKHVREYFYRFHAGGATSPTGRTKTAPDAKATADKLRFAVASCQNYGAGFYTAHRDMAQQDLDAVLFLGDYIYEHNPGNAKTAARSWTFKSSRVVETLEDYRRQYAMYKADPDLQACHAAHPYISTPDDHEVENNWAGDHSEAESTPELIKRRTAAYQAYYENLPFRVSQRPQGSHMQLYRNLSYGKLAQITVLDTRQFRTPQPCNDQRTPNCQERYAESQEIMGRQQNDWLIDSLKSSPSQWNIIAHQTQIADIRRDTPQGPLYSTDNWNGYVAPRKRMSDAMLATNPRNPVFVAGDIHHTSVADLKADYANPKSAIVASEIVGTSISSAGDGVAQAAGFGALKAANPHLQYENHQRGYIICEVDSKRMTSTLRTVNKVTTRDGVVSPAATFVLETDRKGIQIA